MLVQNIAIFYFRFSLAKNRRLKRLCKLCMKYKRTVSESKDIENDFYANDFSNDYLENHI
jgi:hypothetical protein